MHYFDHNFQSFSSFTMNSLFQLLLNLILILLSLLIYFTYYKLKTSPKCTAPEPTGAWPILGHLHLFGGKQLTHKTLGTMADKHGPVFTIRLGSHRALVVNNWELARECFTIHDKVFSTRPCITSSKLLGYDYAMFGFAPYGPYWREMRKIATIQLLSNHRINMLKHIIKSEVEIVIKQLHKLLKDQGSVLVDMKQWFGDMTRNIALRMVGGKRYFGVYADFREVEAVHYTKVMRDFVYLFGVFVLSDAIPLLGWLDINGYEKAMKKTAKELDTLVQGWLEDHKKKILLSGKGKEEQDFMDVMLNIFGDESDISGFDADTVIKATCLNLLVAGSDTTMVTLTWALSLLLNHRQALNKVQDEIDNIVGKDRCVDESDIKNLVYLQAVVKETLRLYPPVPIIGLRAAMEDCTLSSGYFIPAGTRLILNAWKIHHDGQIWTNPHEFKPERFLTTHKDIDLRGHNFELIPFGSGRRSCPGVSLGLEVVHLCLASFLHSFEVNKPSSNEDVDMTESTGLTNLKASPLKVFLTPRLNPKLYV